MSNIIYMDIVDYVENEAFLASTPLYSAPTPDAVKDGLFEEQFIYDKNAFGRSRITIAMMIDFASKKIPFTLLNQPDIITIKEKLDSYIDHLRKMTTDTIIENKLRSSYLFSELLMKSFKAYINTDPILKRKYENQDLSAIFKNYSK